MVSIIDKVKERATEDLKDINVSEDIRQFFIGYCMGIVSWSLDYYRREQRGEYCEHSGASLSEKKT